MNDMAAHMQSQKREGLAPMSCFCVHVGDLQLGIPVADTQSIFKIDNITPVPMCPPQIGGLTNLRGRMLVAISLRSKFDGRAAAIGVGALAIGLQVRGEDYALVVDRVGEVVEVDPSTRIPAPAHFNIEHARMTEGLYQIGETLLPVLNIQALLDQGPTDLQSRGN